MKRLIVILSGLFFLIACSDFKQKEQLKAVEQLTSEATTLSKDFQSSFPDTLSTMRQNMMQLQLFLQQHVVLDSVDRTYAKDMDTYKLARKKNRTDQQTVCGA